MTEATFANMDDMPSSGSTLSEQAANQVKRPGYWRDASQILLGNAGKEYDTAMLNVQGKIDPVILSDKENLHFKSTYASLAAVISYVRPILNAHGFLLRQTTGEIRTHGAGGKGGQYMTVATHITHVESGQWEMLLVPTPVQAQIISIGAALTYGRRVGLLSYLGIATEDNDGMVAIQNRFDQDAANDAAKGITEALEQSKTTKALAEWLSKNEEGLKLLSEQSLGIVRAAYQAHLATLNKKTEK